MVSRWWLIAGISAAAAAVSAPAGHSVTAGAGPLLRCAEGGAAVGDGAEWQGRWLQCLTRCCALVRTLAIAAPSASDAVSDDEPSVRLPPLTRAQTTFMYTSILKGV